MTMKNRLGWLGRSLSTAAMAFALAAVMPACSDDDGDAGNVDAGDTPDAMEMECEGHACPPSNPVLMMPEAGLLRAELYHVGNDPGTGDRVEALGAWFFAFTGQDPAYRPVLGPRIDALSTDTFSCFDNTGHDALVNGYSDELQTIVDSREYYDLGESLTLTGAGGNVIEMARNQDAPDPTNQLIHDYIYLSEPTAAAALERNSSYSLPALAPDANSGFPGLDLRGGFDIPGGANYSVEGRPPAIFMPANFTMQSPTEDAFYADPQAGGWQIDSTSDLAMEWTVDDGVETPADWPTPAQFTAFAALDGNGRPTIEYICIGAAAGGTHTIPQGLFEMPNFPQNGLALHATFTHTAWENPGETADDSHHFSYLAVNCNMSPYSMVTP